MGPSLETACIRPLSCTLWYVVCVPFADCKAAQACDVRMCLGCVFIV